MLRRVVTCSRIGTTIIAAERVRLGIHAYDAVVDLIAFTFADIDRDIRLFRARQFVFPECGGHAAFVN